MRVLGIETSCDETGVAIYDGARGIIGEGLYSQIELHAEFGGVVPELASRDHIRKLAPLHLQVMAEAGCKPEDIDGVAFTTGPGLAGALMVGAMFGRALAYGWGVPALGVHHMEGHLLAPLLAEDTPEFPFIALLVSGGHTQLIRVDGIGEYQLLGESLDDAAGEAFDKAAKMLGLPYPGGPALAKLAATGDRSRFKFPRPMVNRQGLDFSFSGLKTFTLNTIADNRGDGELSGKDRRDIACAFEEAAADTLAIKCARALKQENMKRLIVAGGVSANRRLRQMLDKKLGDMGARAWYPPPRYCTDNGAMIAYAGYCRLNAGQADDLSVLARPRWPLTELEALAS